MTLADQIHNAPTLYYVTYRFHLIESLRVKTKLPKVIERTNLIEARSIEELSQLISTVLGRCIKAGGVLGDNPLTAKQKHGPLFLPNVSEEMMNFDLGVFIPGHMIAYIETITTIKPQQPGSDDDETEVPIQ